MTNQLSVTNQFSGDAEKPKKNANSTSKSSLVPTRASNTSAAQAGICRGTMAGAGGVNSGGELKLLDAWASPFVLRVRVALHLKGLEYEYVEVDLADKSELLLASNPVHTKVPVLLHGGRPVCESMLIVEYLDDAFPGSGRAFLPADPLGRAAARFWAAYVDDELLSAWLAIHAAGTEKEKAEAVTRALAAVDALESALADAESTGAQGWFGGDGAGLMDVALGGFVPAIQASEPTTGLRIVDPGRTPRLAAWVERFCALDAARAAMPAVDRLVEMGKKRLADAEQDAAAAAEVSK